MAEAVTERIVARLGGGEDIRGWVERLAALDVPVPDVSLPDGDELVAELLRLTVPYAVMDDLIALRRSVVDDPDVWWLLQRSVALLAGRMGRALPWEPLPPMPAALGPLRPYFFVYVFIAALPLVRAYHRSIGVPDEVSWRTLTDLGRHMATHRWHYGAEGLDEQVWLTLHFSGQLYQFGRLQFERQPIRPETLTAMRAAGEQVGERTVVLSIHIPGFSGSFSPAACDAAIAEASTFFGRVYPEEDIRYGHCASWLLDRQLLGVLPETSNIIRFQRRFNIFREVVDGDSSSVLRFVFGRRDGTTDGLPETTSLHRSLLGHMRAGKSWGWGEGWCRLW